MMDLEKATTMQQMIIGIILLITVGADLMGITGTITDLEQDLTSDSVVFIISGTGIATITPVTDILTIGITGTMDTMDIIIPE